MSGQEHPEVEAFQELRQLVTGLVEELASFRKRALQAEARLRELEAAGEDVGISSGARLADLERENVDLKARLGAATARTHQMLQRVRFLRQQQQRGTER